MPLAAVFDSSPTVTNSILWGNTAPTGAEIYTDSGAPVVAYSCVQGGYAGTGNISDDPLFVDGTDGGDGWDLQLQEGSPCIDAGTSTGAPGVDILGVSRPQGGGVDMGAYEFVVEGSLFHSADQNNDNLISLSELLRVIQFFNSGGYHCADPPDSAEDGYVPGPGADHACSPHDSDYNPQDWVISLSELLRVIQFYNAGGYHACPDAEPPTEDGFCVGAPLKK